MTNLSELEYHCRVKGITVKLPESTLRRLRQQAQSSRRSVAALIRDRVERLPDEGADSVYTLTSDVAGALKGPRRSATNARRRFRKP